MTGIDDRRKTRKHWSVCRSQQNGSFPGSSDMTASGESTNTQLQQRQRRQRRRRRRRIHNAPRSTPVAIRTFTAQCSALRRVTRSSRATAAFAGTNVYSAAWSVAALNDQQTIFQGNTNALASARVRGVQRRISCVCPLTEICLRGRDRARARVHALPNGVPARPSVYPCTSTATGKTSPAFCERCWRLDATCLG